MDEIPREFMCLCHVLRHGLGGCFHFLTAVFCALCVVTPEGTLPDNGTLGAGAKVEQSMRIRKRVLTIAV